MSVVGKRDDGMLGNASIGVDPGLLGSATESWREKLIVLGVGLVLESVKCAIGLYWLPKITPKTDKSRRNPLFSGIRLG